MAKLLDEIDVLSIINSSTNRFNPENLVTPKIIAARKDPRIITSHIIDPSRFNTIYATSDIHADIRNFLNYLNKLKMIKLPDGLDLYTDDIYNPRFITETDWIMNESLFIIIGDLIDGRRSSSNSITDKVGSFEYLLHMLIYNLRIKAWSKKSDIIFTIGNHDIYNAIKTNREINPPPFGFLESQITDEAKLFFGPSLLFRQKSLGLFYLLSPFLFIQIKNKKTDILMIHSQIMDYNNRSPNVSSNIPIIELLRSIQTKIDNDIINQNELFIKLPNINQIDLILSMRNIEDDIDLCENYKRIQSSIPNIIVVGHCPTIFSIGDSVQYKPHIKSIISGKIGIDEEYEMCNNDKNYGCVLPRCYRNEHDIRIIMVDTGMSSCFRKKGPYQSDIEKTEMERNRVSEILKITYYEHKLGDSYKIFNKLYRLRTDNREIRIKPKDDKRKSIWLKQYIPDISKKRNIKLPYPLTIDFIKKLMKDDYPKMPKEKYDFLIKEFEKMNFKDLEPGEIIFPTLPPNFWKGTNSFREKYEKYKAKYLHLINNNEILEKGLELNNVLIGGNKKEKENITLALYESNQVQENLY